MLAWQTFDENANYRQALFVYKTLNLYWCLWLHERYVQMSYQVSTQTLRSSAEDKHHLQKIHPESRAIDFSGPRIWNSSSKEVRNANSVRHFKYLYHRQFFISVNSLQILVSAALDLGPNGGRAYCSVGYNCTLYVESKKIRPIY